ncbi:MAG: hypothetical protein ACSHWW_07735 [Nonlabens sp.]|uniref:hypothetical protein n=1 Tax=Nonlabens sp. TaxID=1888209 RepID=UPI003EF8CA7F
MKHLLKKIIGVKNLNSLRRFKKRHSKPSKSIHFLTKKKHRRTLVDIANYYGTDKVDKVHQFKNKSYIDIYDSYFKDKRDDEISFLEIGVKEGYSLETWNSYFTNGKIKGLDIDPRCKKFEKKGIEIAIGSQIDIDFLKKAFIDIPEFDVILDDGAHVNHMIKKTFNYLFYDRLKSGGMYIIEDLGCSYSKLQTEHNVKESWPGMKYNGNETLDNDRSEMDTFFNQLIYDLDHLKGEVFSIHFYSRICIITKC